MRHCILIILIFPALANAGELECRDAKREYEYSLTVEDYEAFVSCDEEGMSGIADLLIGGFDRVPVVEMCDAIECDENGCRQVKC